MDRLPYVDEHTRAVPVVAQVAFDAVRAVAGALAGQPLPRLFVRIWDPRPETGFAVVEMVAPDRVILRGSHRFSTYELAFLISQTAQGSIVRARTSATFPGLTGKLYRTLVFGSGGHIVAVRSMLRRIARRASS